MTQKKKLIEVALPLEAINKAAAREKSIRHGHPSTLHLWWARRPLAAARAVIFAQMVDDPSSYPDLFPTDREQKKERGRLFKIIEELVQWENTDNDEVIQRARDAIWESWRRACSENVDHARAHELFDRNVLPSFHDPFGGGGTLPLEAQRLGMNSYASDLNPVAVLINKAMIEIPPLFAGRPPVNPSWQSKDDSERALTLWERAQGLAEDVLFYGEWMRAEARKLIGDLYPEVEVTTEMAADRLDLKPYVGRKLRVIAWLWARTVKSPNPAFKDVAVPLASTFMLSTKAGREAYVEPKIEQSDYKFVVKTGKPKDLDSVKRGTKVGRGGHFQCLISGSPIPVEYIRECGVRGEMGSRLMAIIAEGDRGRVYLSPSTLQEDAADKAKPDWGPEVEINYNPRDIRTQLYGLTTYKDLFTKRQIVALSTYSNLVEKAISKIEQDALASGLAANSTTICDRGNGALAYAQAVGVYLGLAVGRSANYWSTLTPWGGDFIVQTFGRQALPMVWDYAEGNPFSDSTGNWMGALSWIQNVISRSLPACESGFVAQADAQTQTISKDKVVSTDPPYYDNIGYADLSDYFYVWHRRAMRSIYPSLFSTMAVPKSEELVATPYRHGSREKAETFFLDGMTDAMHRIAEVSHPAFPVTIYYAFKQSETDTTDGTTNTGWDTFLAAVIEAGFEITGTWPMRTERDQGLKSGSNFLASSIVLVCRPKKHEAQAATRREFVNALKSELPAALAYLQAGNIAPVDFAQAAIGPGMGIYTRYVHVLDADGRPISVRQALALINQTLDESLAEQEGDFDADTRWALSWFEQLGFDEGEFGVAEQLSKAKNTAVEGLVEAGIIASGKGKVRLLKPTELPTDWDPSTDMRLTVWEVVHHLVRLLEAGGESAAANIVSKLGSKSDTARELCYRLYTLCERKKRANEAMAYNALVQSWPEIVRLSREGPGISTTQTDDLFNQE